MKSVSIICATTSMTVAASFGCTFAEPETSPPPSRTSTSRLRFMRVTAGLNGRVRRESRSQAQPSLSGLFEPTNKETTQGPSTFTTNRPSTTSPINASTVDNSSSSRIVSRSSSWIRRLSSFSSTKSAPVSPRPHSPTAKKRPNKLVKRFSGTDVNTSRGRTSLGAFTTDKLHSANSSQKTPSDAHTQALLVDPLLEPRHPPYGWKAYFTIQKIRSGGRTMKRIVRGSIPVLVSARDVNPPRTALDRDEAGSVDAENEWDADWEPSSNKHTSSSQDPPSHNREPSNLHMPSPRKSFLFKDLLNSPWNSQDWTRNKSARQSHSPPLLQSRPKAPPAETGELSPTTSDGSQMTELPPDDQRNDHSPSIDFSAPASPIVSGDEESNAPPFSIPIDSGPLQEANVSNRNYNTATSSTFTGGTSTTQYLPSDSDTSEFPSSPPECGQKEPKVRPLSTSHSRSQSLPVVPGSSRANTAKFGTWGVGCTAVSEEWDDDFDFAGEEKDDDLEGSDPRADSGVSMIVPHAIREQQSAVRANIGLLREWGLLIEDLKSLKRRFAATGKPVTGVIWAQADAMIELADHEPDEKPPNWSTPPSSPGLDLDAFDEISPSPSDRRRRRQPRKSVLQNANLFSDPASPLGNSLNLAAPSPANGAVSPIFGSPSPIMPAKATPFPPLQFPTTTSSKEPAPSLSTTVTPSLGPAITFQTRPRQNSEALAKSVIRAVQSRIGPLEPGEACLSGSSLNTSPSKKVPFDTATLKHIVPYLGRLVSTVRRMVEEGGEEEWNGGWEEDKELPGVI